MKNYNFLYLIIIYLMAPTIAMQMPKEQLPAHIDKILAETASLDVAVKALRSLQINDEQIHDLLVKLGNRYFNGNLTNAAWVLKTPAALNWFNAPKAKEWFQEHQKNIPFLDHDFSFLLYDSGKDPWARDRVMSLLAIGFNPNIQIKSRRGYYTPLDIALNHNDLELFKRLLAAGADSNSINTEENMTILERAAWDKKIPFLKALIYSKANRNPIRNGGNLIQALERVNRNGNYDEVINLLKQGEQPESLTQQAINETAKQIKAEKLTLEDAKKRIPVDLHEALEKAVKK